MRKEGTIALLILFSMNFVSATSFSIGDFLNSFDASTIILVNLFIIFFALIYWILVRALKGNQAIAGVIAFSMK